MRRKLDDNSTTVTDVYRLPQSLKDAVNARANELGVGKAELIRNFWIKWLYETKHLRRKR